MANVDGSGIDYNEVPADFPYGDDERSPDRWFAWTICEEVVLHLCKKCGLLKSKSHRSVRPVDILYQEYLQICALGWGTEQEIRFVFRRVAACLKWPAPDAVRRP